MVEKREFFDHMSTMTRGAPGRQRQAGTAAFSAVDTTAGTPPSGTWTAPSSGAAEVEGELGGS